MEVLIVLCFGVAFCVVCTLRASFIFLVYVSLSN